MISFSTYDTQRGNAKFGTRFPLPFSPFLKANVRLCPPAPGRNAGLERIWKAFSGLVQMENWKRCKHSLWFPGIIHSQGHTCTDVGRKIAVGMLTAADVCLRFLILTKALLLLSLLLPCCCSLPLGFLCPTCSCKYLPTKGGGKGSQKVVTAAPSSVDLGLHAVFLFHQPHVSMRACIPRAVFASRLSSIKVSSQGNLLIRACWEENAKQRMM